MNRTDEDDLVRLGERRGDLGRDLRERLQHQREDGRVPVLQNSIELSIEIPKRYINNTQLYITCLYADAFILILSASALPTASTALASAAPTSLIFSPSARAPSIVLVLQKVDIRTLHMHFGSDSRN